MERDTTFESRAKKINKYVSTYLQGNKIYIKEKAWLKIIN